MDLDQRSTPGPRVGLTIPRAGVREVWRGYSGEGTVYDDVAGGASADALGWSASDVRGRARRVLLGLVAPICERWPATVAAWEPHLPVSAASERQVTRQPESGTNWSQTRRLHGWPPRAFSGRRRHRVTDELTLQILAWVVAELRDATTAGPGLAPLTSQRVEAHVRLAEEVLTQQHDPSPLRPDRTDLRALASSGHPWRSVAEVAELLLRAEHDPEFIVFDLIAPDPEGGARLFHLGVFGLVMRALRNHRFVVTWRRPVSGTRSGAQVEALAPSGARYELWFEAAAARRAYGLPASTYADAVAGIPGAGGVIGVDVMLIEPHRRALLLECKWSADATYVGRDGYHQSASYALDARGGLADDIWSFTIGPQEVVDDTGMTTHLREPLGIILGSTSPLHVTDLVSAFLADDPTSLL
jgi:hypothetical protein